MSYSEKGKKKKNTKGREEEKRILRGVIFLKQTIRGGKKRQGGVEVVR